MMSKKRSTSESSRKRPGGRTPPSFGEQWRSKGDAFTRSVTQGRWGPKHPKAGPKS
jgi:hypothetical protein